MLHIDPSRFSSPSQRRTRAEKPHKLTLVTGVFAAGVHRERSFSRAHANRHVPSEWADLGGLACVVIRKAVSTKCHFYISLILEAVGRYPPAASGTVGALRLKSLTFLQHLWNGTLLQPEREEEGWECCGGVILTGKWRKLAAG